LLTTGAASAVMAACHGGGHLGSRRTHPWGKSDDGDHSTQPTFHGRLGRAAQRARGAIVRPAFSLGQPSRRLADFRGYAATFVRALGSSTDSPAEKMACGTGVFADRSTGPARGPRPSRLLNRPASPPTCQKNDYELRFFEQSPRLDVTRSAGGHAQWTALTGSVCDRCSRFWEPF
jgi:hypothetical protein